VEAVVFNLDSEEAVAVYRFVAHTPSTVEPAQRGDETEAEAVERFARSALQKDMRRQIHDPLTEVTGGKVQWDSTPDGTQRNSPAAGCGE
jgi:hypothetical protein